MENMVNPLKLFVLFLACLCASNTLSAQSLNQLEEQLKATDNDSLKIELLEKLIESYEGIDYNKSKEYATQLLTLAEETGQNWALLKTYRRLNLSYVLEGDFSTAMKYGNLFYQKAVELADTSAISEAINMMGDNYFDLGEFDEAYDYFTDAFRFGKRANDSLRMTIALHNVGRVFKVLGQYETALDHFRLSEKISTTINDKLGAPYTFDELGDLYLRQGKVDSALYYLTKSLALSRELSDEILEPRTIDRIANAYVLKKDYKTALAYYDTALMRNQITKNKLGIAYNELGKGIIFLQQDKFKDAEQAIENALIIADQLNAKTLGLRCYQQLSELSEKKGDYQKALLYYRTYKAREDSLFGQGMKDKLFRDQLQNQNEVRDSKIAAMIREQEIQKNEIKKQEFIRNIFVVLVALTGILLITVYRSGQRRRHINKLLLEHQDEMRKRSVELEKLNQVKDKFFSIISHDLRSPINALAGLLDIMDRGGLSEQDMKANIRELKVRFNHTRTLLNNLLDWTLLQMDKLSLQPAKISLHKIASENIQLLSAVQNKNIRFENQIPENTIAFADSNTINLVMRNLLTNAIKFTNENGNITLQASEEEKLWRIGIKDDGVGMNKSVVSMLFDKTAPYSTRGTANEKGTGLGLILCKEFVEKNGGTIWVESEEGKGSTFTFTIPKANQ
ncbi:MAG: ATP-binding protein [Chryseotalea sp.]|jgi:signal transduction histidine kinase